MATTSPETKPADASRLAEMAQRIAGTFGEVVALLMRSPRHRFNFVSDLEWQVVPAIATGQFAVAEARHKDTGIAAPVAMVMWASVSDAVDQRLASSPSDTIRLKPDEWKSGPHVWLVDAVGDRRGVEALLKRVFAGPMQGRAMKVVTRNPKGGFRVQEIRQGRMPAEAAAGPAPDGGTAAGGS